MYLMPAELLLMARSADSPQRGCYGLRVFTLNGLVPMDQQAADFGGLHLDGGGSARTRGNLHQD